MMQCVLSQVKHIKAECETQIIQHLARATEAHLLTVQDLEVQQEAKLVQKHAAIMNDLVQTTQTRNAKVLTEMQKQMSEIDGLVKGIMHLGSTSSVSLIFPVSFSVTTHLSSLYLARANADQSAIRAQMLWTACNSVVQSLRRLQPLQNYEEKVVSIKDEIKAVSSSSCKSLLFHKLEMNPLLFTSYYLLTSCPLFLAVENDQLVSAVLQGIPKEAINRGVFTEEALMERFQKVIKT